MADDEDVCVKLRQRCVIECCVNLGKSGNETLEMLLQAYGGEALSGAPVFQWCGHFKDGNTRVIEKSTFWQTIHCGYGMSILPRLWGCWKMTEG